MSQNDHKQGQPKPDAAMRSFLSFVTDARLMEEDELDELLSEVGIDYAAFDARLTNDIERAKGKAFLKQASVNRGAFKDRIQRKVSTFAMSLEEKRREIEQRLGLLGNGQAATMFNRNYENAEDDDLDGLLESLRALDERADAKNDEG